MLYIPEAIGGDGGISGRYYEDFSEVGGRNFLVPGSCFKSSF